MMNRDGQFCQSPRIIIASVGEGSGVRRGGMFCRDAGKQIPSA